MTLKAKYRNNSAKKRERIKEKIKAKIEAGRFSGGPNPAASNRQAEAKYAAKCKKDLGCDDRDISKRMYRHRQQLEKNKKLVAHLRDHCPDQYNRAPVYDYNPETKKVEAVDS